MKTEPNDPAHRDLCCHITNEGLLSEVWLQGGLTKREEIASRALQGILAASDWRIMGLGDTAIEDAAVFSVKVADRLIDALNRKEL